MTAHPAGTRLLKHLKEQVATSLKLEASVARVKEVCSDSSKMSTVDEFVTADKELHQPGVLALAGKECLSNLGSAVAGWLVVAGKQIDRIVAKVLKGEKEEVVFDDSGVVKDVEMSDLCLQLTNISRMQLLKLNTDMSKQLVSGVSLLETISTGPLRHLRPSESTNMHDFERLATMMSALVQHANEDAINATQFPKATLDELNLRRRQAEERLLHIGHAQDEDFD